jgi:hypothetical protein
LRSLYYYYLCSCEIVALRENFVDRMENYDSFSAKSCVFLVHGWGIFLHSHSQPDLKQGIKKFLKHIPTNLIQSLTMLTSRIRQMMAKNSSVGFSKLLWTMSDILKFSDGRRVVEKCHSNFLIPCFGSGYVWGWRNIPQTMCVFFCAQEIYNF